MSVRWGIELNAEDFDSSLTRELYFQNRQARRKQQLRSLYRELEVYRQSRRIAQAMKIRIIEPVFFQGADRKPGDILDVEDGPWRKVPPASFPSAYGYDLVPQFEEIVAEIRKQSMSVIDRIKAKALQARDIVPTAIKEFEADLDSIIAGGPMLATKRAEAVGPHKEATSGLLKEIDGLKGAMDILSNGGDPLDGSKNTGHG